MNSADIKPGDKVRILEWDELVELYGEVSVQGTLKWIPMRPGFVDQMDYLCGQVLTVKVVNTDYITSEEHAEGDWKIPLSACVKADAAAKLEPLKAVEHIEEVLFS